MSYEIVKAIKVKDNDEVWIKSDSNNVFPKNYHWWHCVTLTKLLKEQGREALDKAILREYWDGNFQKTNNDYEKCLRLCDRRYADVDNHLLDCYRQYKSRDKTPLVMIYTGGYGSETFVKRKTARHMFLTDSVDKAKVVRGQLEAEYYLRNYKKEDFNLMSYAEAKTK